ncbi:6-phosphogluconate dehydrogenase (decarboxylating) [Candidatus Peregrinibacteria bacterium CG11_big_fil_rev_8_21_14_0_20_46_8]|nr:MAG: 6-phosphogluconate dehydrogenase (decarboxylating) [Candidatus Peregrinibacteria bacterium CG11_big_fil_rev_8_21_14_0_20_46_8]
MKIGYLGLGKMGYAMCENLLEHDWEVVAYNRSTEKAEQLAAAYEKAHAAPTLEDLIAKLPKPRLVWVMVPNSAVEEMLKKLVPLLEEGDTVIDGGNTFYKETVERAKWIEEHGVNFLDVGVSGGPGGARKGACMMIGGNDEIFKQHEKLFKDTCVEHGYGYFGKHGAGHFVKMVHNGIEYGMMQAIGEGFEVLKKSDFNLDLKKAAEVYNHGSVITSSLIGWLESAYEKHGVDLDTISGEVSHSGEGQWTVEAAREMNIPVPIIEGSLRFRVDSQGNPSYTGQVVSTLRNQFGGHDVEKKD